MTGATCNPEHQKSHAPTRQQHAIGQRDPGNVRIDKVFDELRKISFFGEFSGELPGLFGCRNLTCQEEPEHTLGDDLLASWRRRKNLLAVGNSKTVEADTLVYLRLSTDL